uniref:(northern house mosquito) hypothetical protein n=1 Tax=Culex pipiens TaxID=7175 RepID=A0A8D8AW64_CULPI
MSQRSGTHCGATRASTRFFSGPLQIHQNLFTRELLHHEPLRFHFTGCFPVKPILGRNTLCSRSSRAYAAGLRPTASTDPGVCFVLYYYCIYSPHFPLAVHINSAVFVCLLHCRPRLPPVRPKKVTLDRKPVFQQHKQYPYSAVCTVLNAADHPYRTIARASIQNTRALEYKPRPKGCTNPTLQNWNQQTAVHRTMEITITRLPASSTTTPQKGLFSSGSCVDSALAPLAAADTWRTSSCFTQLVTISREESSQNVNLLPRRNTRKKTSPHTHTLA